jgi:hypothetical protein
MFFLQLRLLFLPDKGKVVILPFTISVSAFHALVALPLLFTFKVSAKNGLYLSIWGQNKLSRPY